MTSIEASLQPMTRRPAIPPHAERQDAWHRGEFMQTYTGRRFYPGDPRPAEIDIRDVAHHLANLCRFTGATKKHYSVAQHCVLVSYAVQPENALWGLLHDAAEAYVNDVSRPVKYQDCMTGYRDMEKKIMEAVKQKFGLQGPEPDEVKSADVFIVAAERRDLFVTAPDHLIELPAPFDQKIEPWFQGQAKRMFLDRYNELKGNKKKGGRN